MPKLSNFVYCEQTSPEENAIQSLNPLNVITIESAPGRFSFSVVFSLVGFNPHEEHDGYIVFADPNGKTVIETERFTLEKEDHDKKNPILTGVSMGVEFNNVLLEMPGLFRTDLYFDNEKIGEFVIPVVTREGVLRNE
ncbi:DUF6941 family protein [Priestia flexa]|uniref:DUF6941 family protein n=1 Tax=Priestia flexa TaxID=86664 RepID=UPI003F86A5D8